MSEQTNVGDVPFEVRPHHLLCAVCAVAGCSNPPCGLQEAERIRKAIKADAYLPLSLVVDLDVARVHYRDIYLGGGAGMADFRRRQLDYVGRTKDLEVMRRLGLRPNTVHPAAEVVPLLFQRIESLEGICFFSGEPSPNWPECPCARQDYFKQVRGDGKYYSLAQRTELGETLDGKGMFSLLPIRTRAEMAQAKQESRKSIGKADRLFVLPAHLLCLLCAWAGGMLDKGPLAVDNLFEILEKIRNNPDMPVTLVEGICMVCDPCSGYDLERNLCMHGFVRIQLRNLMVLRKLGLAPGATLKARDLFKLLFERIETAREICGWGDMQSTSPIWGACGGATSGNYERVRQRGVDSLFAAAR
jgi:hypothetical protein